MTKRRVILYGNCHMFVIEDYFKNSKKFNEKYTIIHIPPIQSLTIEKLSSIPFDECDCFIHQQIRLENKFGKEFSSEYIIKRLKKDCEIIAIPNLYHLPKYMFPQYYSDEDLTYKGRSIFFRDEIIEKYFYAGYSCEQIADEYRKHRYSVDILDCLYEEFISKVKKRELEWDIKISDYLLKNKSEVLFYDPNHPNDMVFSYIIEKLFEFLCIEDDVNELTKKEHMQLDTYQMPICNDVFKWMGKKEDEKTEIKMHIGRKLNYRRMFLKEYVRQYVGVMFLNDESLEASLKKYSKRIFYQEQLIGAPYFIMHFMKSILYKLYKMIGRKR